MEELKKRQFFTADEKVYIKELASKYKDIVENKSDVVSVSTKKRKWQDIAVEFNLNSQYTKRSPEQIKKCWENMKTKRKSELAQEKRDRMSTGGGPFPGTSTDDPQLDPLEVVNVEVQDVIDSDTLALIASNGSDGTYILCEDGTLGASNDEALNEGPLKISDEKMTRSIGKKDIRKEVLIKESDKRLERCDIIQQQDKELHSFRLREMEFKIKTAEIEFKKAEAELQKTQLEIEHMKEKHEMEMKKLKKSCN